MNLARYILPVNRRLIGFPAFLLLLFVATGACQARDLDSVSRPMLWELDTTPTSYLFGTIHVPDPRVTVLSPEVEAAFRTSDAVLTEIELDPESMTGLAARMMRTDGKTLSEVLPESVHSRLEKRLKKINPLLTTEALQSMKTWGVYAAVLLLESQLKHPDIQPLDVLLYERAQEEGKETGGLETLEEQLGYFEQFSEEEQAKLLTTVLNQMDEADAKGEDMIQTLIQWYLNGDVESLAELLNEMPLAEDKALEARIEKVLLTDRNRLIAERIAALLESESGRGYFFAVGAAHLGGEQSILDNLMKRGYSANQVGTSVQK